MIVTGNDNYRPGLEPPTPIKGGSGWLSGHMAQLMVFLNGLILTITAFATLSVFISEIVNDSLRQASEDTKTYIVSEYQDIENQITFMGEMMSMFDYTGKEMYINHAIEDAKASTGFESLYWVTKDLERDAWVIYNPLNNSEKFRNELFTIIKSNYSAGDKEPLKFVSEVPQDILGKSEEGEINKGKLFSFVYKVNVRGRTTDYLVGVARFDKFLDTAWLKDRQMVDMVSVYDSDAQMSIFDFKKDSNADGDFQKNFETKIFDTNFANKNIGIKIDMILSSREAFLKKIPLLMLVFGLTLTLIGTLYVRNNQKQSLRLAKMNKELAHKNFELNQEFTEREKLNKAMESSEREHRSIINSVSDIIFEVDGRGKILFLNETWNKITGFELDRSIGRTIFDLIYTQDQDEQKQNFDQLLKGQSTSYRSFTRIRTAEGTFRAVELAVSMIRQDQNEELRIVGTITDVEERRRAERALSEAEKKYRAIVENAASGIYQVTPEGYFLSANPALSAVLGYELPEEVLRDIVDSNEQIYVDPYARKKFLQEVSTSGVSKNFEAQIKKKDGEITWVSENVRPVKDDEGTLLYFEGSMEDVDQRKRAEIALFEAKTESDLANRAKSEFLANMSHELRTPLNSIIGFSSIITDEAYGKIEQAEYGEYAENINESGKGLLNVINEILDVSRIEAGERQLNEGAVNLEQTIDSCLALVENKVKDNDLRITSLAGQTKAGLIGETQAIKQMILNLLSNAIKFTPAHGVITIGEEVDSKGGLRISITDTGVGLNEDEIQKALSPFGQLDSDLNRSGSGTGLGLTLVSSLINLHGGKLELVSQKGVGTTATLIFPESRVSLPKEGIVEEELETLKEVEEQKPDVFSQELMDQLSEDL